MQERHKLLNRSVRIVCYNKSAGGRGVPCLAQSGHIQPRNNKANTRL